MGTTYYNGEKKFNLVCPECKQKQVKFVQSIGTNKNQKIYQCFNCNQLWNNRNLRNEDKINMKNEILGSSLFRLESGIIQEYYILRENKDSYFIQNKDRNKAFTIKISEIDDDEWFSNKKQLLKSTIDTINLEIDELSLERSKISNQIKRNRELLNQLKAQK